MNFFVRKKKYRLYVNKKKIKRLLISHRMNPTPGLDTNSYPRRFDFKEVTIFSSTAYQRGVLQCIKNLLRTPQINTPWLHSLLLPYARAHNQPEAKRWVRMCERNHLMPCQRTHLARMEVRVTAHNFSPPHLAIIHQKVLK